MDPVFIQIPNELFQPSAHSRITGELSPFELEVGLDTYMFDDNLIWQADLTNTGDAILVSGQVDGAAKTVCVRCLEEMTLPIAGEIEGYFLIDDDSTHASDDPEEDEFEVLPDDHMIDMGALIKAAILLEIPLLPLCREDCKGLCSICGANLNDGPCDCTTSEFDKDFELEKNPFAALRDFSFDDSAPM